LSSSFRSAMASLFDDTCARTIAMLSSAAYSRIMLWLSTLVWEIEIIIPLLRYLEPHGALPYRLVNPLECLEPQHLYVIAMS
jgi:hypothetical protein